MKKFSSSSALTSCAGFYITFTILGMTLRTLLMTSSLGVRNQSSSVTMTVLLDHPMALNAWTRSLAMSQILNIRKIIFKYPWESLKYCGYFKWEKIISVSINCYRNDNRCVCLGLQNPSGHCHYLCKLLRRNEVLWPHAFPSNSWIGAASLPTLVLLWCRYKWNPSGSSSYTTMKEKNSSNFSVSLISCQEAAQTETSQVRSNKARSTCTEHEHKPSKALDIPQPGTLQSWLATLRNAHSWSVDL